MNIAEYTEYLCNILQNSLLEPHELSYRTQRIKEAEGISGSQISIVSDRYYSLAHEIKALKYLNQFGFVQAAADHNHESGCDYILNNKYQIECVCSTAGDSSTNVSFVPMAVVSETDMYFSVQEQRPLKEVYAGYTYFRDNDVLLAKVTPCFENGKSGLARNLENGIGFGSSEFFVLRANLEKVLPEYIYYIINSNRFITEGTPQMTGTGGLRRLTKDFVLNYPVSLPTLNEQRRIVSQTEEEIAIVEQDKRLIQIFEKKINDKISEVWGE